jgi:Fibronectin type III domain
MKERIAGAVAVCLMSCAVCLVSAAGATAAETHVFDAVLSLTGSCDTAPIDPVADPGCPEDIPPKAFTAPKSVAVGPYGEIYVASYGKEAANGAEGRVDVFDSSGFYITEILVPNGPRSLGVDSKGNLYVYEFSVGKIKQISLYKPSVYKPDSGEIVYGNAPVVAVPENVPVGESTRLLPPNNGLAVDRTNDHLFVHFSNSIFEFGSAEEGNKLLNSTIGKGLLEFGAWIEIDAKRRLIYASNSDNSLLNSEVLVFEADSPYELVRAIDGSTTPEGSFKTTAGLISIAVDEGSGNVFIDDLEKTSRVYEFTETGEYVSTIEHNFKYVIPSEIEVDNGINSPNGALNPYGRYLFVPSHPSGVGHAFAFGPVEPPKSPPSIDSISVAGVTETEAELRASIDPNNVPEATYRIEYTSFEDEGFASAIVAKEGTLPVADVGVPVSVSLTGLTPGTAYRFRVVAENQVGEDTATSQFSTYPSVPVSPPCPNDALRVGPSALLPDCRAYELVTPPSTNGRPPQGIGFVGDRFTTFETSPLGDKVSFQVEGGSLPGGEGTGAFNGDPYLATRGATGWSTANAGPTGAESLAPLPGGVSSDQGYSFWSTSKGEEGSAAIDGQETRYVRYPDGRSELIGRGSLDVDPRALGLQITENGEHIIFRTWESAGVTPIQLEEDAPPTGTEVIYDRTADEITHVVSLLPGNVTPGAEEDALYRGASADGEGIAFAIDGTLYLRKGNAETFEIATGSWLAAGVSEGGERVFYVQGGNLFAFDTGSESTVQFTASGDVTPVNVSSDGSRAYLLSSSILSGGEENSTGDVAQAGKPNLYLSEEGTIRFVATVTETDVKQKIPASGESIGLGVWTEAVTSRRLAADTSRTTPDGTVLLFESRADLTSSGLEGKVQVYRYDSIAGTLSCLSCNPTGAPATTDASLQSIAAQQISLEPFSSFGFVPSLRADGRRAFFQSSEPLVINDTDERQDVYEWEASGVGTCKEAGGCVSLISSGRSARDDYLYAISQSGDDVFFLSGDLLLPADAENTPSIYDARVGGGFPEPAAPDPCLGESCRPQMSLPPPPLTPAPPSAGDDNVKERKRVTCPKGKRKVKRNGKVRCVKKHRKGAWHKGGKK